MVVRLQCPPCTCPAYTPCLVICRCDGHGKRIIRSAAMLGDLPSAFCVYDHSHVGVVYFRPRVLDTGILVSFHERFGTPELIVVTGQLDRREKRQSIHINSIGEILHLICL